MRESISEPRLWFYLVLWLLGSLGYSTFLAPSQPGSTVPTVSQSSWGLGVVVPEGSSLAGGGHLFWSNVENVTALFQIPNISNPGGTTYAILSLMTSKGSVLQSAVGVLPGEHRWLVDTMFVGRIMEVPQVYHWILNSSAPASSPGQTITISIYRGSTWITAVRNLETGSSVEVSYAVEANQTLALEDQEVFALESYAIDSGTFVNMGLMTLESIYVDGTRALGPWYIYGDWDPAHSLTFVVGGAPPPAFMGIRISGQGTAQWYFAGLMGGEPLGGAKGPVTLVTALVVGASLALVLAMEAHVGMKERKKSQTEG